MTKSTIRIIKGKRYNTETATAVGSWSNGYGHSDFHYVDETLYRTPTGGWFLIGEGGALSRYAQSCGHNSTCGGRDWYVLTDDEAFEWLQRREQTEALELFFSDRIQDA
jgi:hypothetical protein